MAGQCEAAPTTTMGLELWAWCRSSADIYRVHDLAKDHWCLDNTRRLIDQLDCGKVEQEREEQNRENIQ